MQHIYQPHLQFNILRLSDGAEHHKREEGAFEVRYDTATSRFFTTLVSAFVFYLGLKESAALYDVTEEEKLIERKLQIELRPGALVA